MPVRAFAYRRKLAYWSFHERLSRHAKFDPNESVVSMSSNSASSSSECRCCDPRTAAVALGRWCFGVLFFFAGIGKLGSVSGFTGYLAKQFEKTWLPPMLLNIFGHVLPFLEVALGALLILGLFRNATLFAASLLLIALMFGQMLLAQPQVVFFNAAYAFMAAALLFLERFDYWVLFPKPGGRPQTEPSRPPEDSGHTSPQL